MNQIDIDLKALPKDMQAWVNYEITASNANDSGAAPKQKGSACR
jgi:hypothetical protein